MHELVVEHSRQLAGMARRAAHADHPAVEAGRREPEQSRELAIEDVGVVDPDPLPAYQMDRIVVEELVAGGEAGSPAAPQFVVGRAHNAS